jgi:ATP-dependent protease HslVU (ClpYQ) peptidase subunit
MTTIVATRLAMAADRRVSGGGIRYKTKKIRRYGDAIVGVAGDGASVARFFLWFAERGEKGPPKMGKDAELEALILTPAGLFVCGSECALDEVEDEFFAIGSGAGPALGAMHMGASVKVAIEIAGRVDPATGDGIDILTL